MSQHDAFYRFWATIAAQLGGVLVLFFIGIIFFVGDFSHRKDVELGVQWIFVIAFLVFIGLIIGALRAFFWAHKCGGFDHPCVDKTIETFLIVDIPLLTILVCQQGGLSRSIFFSLFFLIPVAHLAVEQEGKRIRVLKGLLAIAISMVITFIVSFSVSYGFNNLFGIDFLTVTDFTSSTPKRFAAGVLIVSLITLLIPILQMKIIRLPSSSLLKVSDILDWSGFCSTLSHEGGTTVPSPSRRILELLPQDTRELVLATAQTNNLEPLQKSKIIDALNGILKRRDFYQADCFERLGVTDEVNPLLSRTRMDLSDSEVERLNRLLIEASYPQQIMKSRISEEKDNNQIHLSIK